MNREIKFRAWSKTSKKMLDRVLAGPGDPCSIVWIEEREEWVNFDEACGVIMQFTGLKDKNGKDIYQDDIIKADWHWEGPHRVIWPDDYYGITEYGLDSNFDIEVIGNVWENGDLLK